MSHFLSHLCVACLMDATLTILGIIMTFEEQNPHGLSPEELSVLHFWQNGDNMTDAYKRVMISKFDESIISDAALKKRVLRFFSTYRMREAMADTPGERGEKARTDFERWKASQKADTIKQFIPQAAPKFEEHYNLHTGRSSSQDENSSDNDSEDETEQRNTEQPDYVNTEGETSERTDNQSRKDRGTYYDQIVKPQIDKFNNVDVQNPSSFKYRTDRERWLASLNISENPTAMTIYGTGQYLAYIAVKEIMAREKAIKENNISVLSDKGSALTPTIISALKTAAAMVLPFAPAPTVEDRRDMTKAAVLLGLMPENITESPDDFTAPPPATIEVSDE